MCKKIFPFFHKLKPLQVQINIPITMNTPVNYLVANIQLQKITGKKEPHCTCSHKPTVLPNTKAPTKISIS